MADPIDDQLLTLFKALRRLAEIIRQEKSELYKDLTDIIEMGEEKDGGG
jgi:hypothetical protein